MRTFSSEIRELLTIGDRKGAVQVAIQNKCWSEAMMIAAFIDQDTYKVACFVNFFYSTGMFEEAFYFLESSIIFRKRYVRSGRSMSNSIYDFRWRGECWLVDALLTLWKNHIW